MNKEDIIRMAREAGIGPVYGYESIERFAALVAAAEQQKMMERIRHIIVQSEERGAAAEREECAKVCEEIKGVKLQGYEFAAAIRARGQAA